MREYKVNESLAFNSYNENFVFSNMYPCSIEYNGINFCGVDHLFHYLLFNGYNDIQSKILKCNGINGNFKAKQIAEKHRDKISNIDSKDRYNILYQCIKLKSEQCELFRNKLMDSKGRYLVEFAFWGDKEYGCVLENGCYVGKNACGRLMMKVREELN